MILSITAAVAQMTSLDGNVISNLDHASDLIHDAVTRGAKLVLFPEFMSQGYRLTTEIWDSAEPFDGPTVSWLRESARMHNIYVGSSFLESANGSFFNTFALAEPGGKIAGRVYKRNPSMWEAYFFEGVKGPHYIDTELGRIGVGICFDNHTWEVATALRECKIDLMLMPHSYCTPTVENKITSAEDITRLNNLPGRVARLYNDMFGVPVILCNKSGPWDSPVPKTILGTPKNFRFSGRSVIIDSDGTVKAELGDEERIAEAEIAIDPSLKRDTRVPKHSRYIYPGPPGRELLRLMELRGRLFYNTSRLRKQKGQSI